MRTMAVSTGQTTLCSTMCPGLSAGHTHTAATASVSTCQSAKVRIVGCCNVGPLNSIFKKNNFNNISSFILKRSTAEWADQKCHSDLPYICKRVNVTGTIPPTPSTPLPPAGCPDGWGPFLHKVGLLGYVVSTVLIKMCQLHECDITVLCYDLIFHFSLSVVIRSHVRSQTDL